MQTEKSFCSCLGLIFLEAMEIMELDGHGWSSLLLKVWLRVLGVL